MIASTACDRLEACAWHVIGVNAPRTQARTVGPMGQVMQIKVLGAGCSKCRSTIGLIERAALEAGVDVEIVKVESASEIGAFGVRATPAVVIGERVVHSGGVPSQGAVQAWFKPAGVGFVERPTRHLFFTGKGGVGKTSLSTATALALADAGRKVLLVSTDAASNLDEMLGIELRNTPVPVPGAPGLSVLNIDPDHAAESYRQRVLAQMPAGASAEALSTVPEVTPVSQAAALQDDLRRARIEPYAWVLNKSVLAAGTQDPVLKARLAGEWRQIQRLNTGLAQRLYALPWLGPMRWPSPPHPAGLPRVSGDGPQSTPGALLIARAAPRERGWALESHRRAVGHHGCPA